MLTSIFQCSVTITKEKDGMASPVREKVMTVTKKMSYDDDYGYEPSYGKIKL